ncbi:DEAD/DEAH box helicase [Brevibacillus panacihumi]|nr:helicase-related protein [Brevibacillus panacihumi]
MARVNNIKRTEEIFPFYSKYAEFQPVIIHSRIKPSEKTQIIDKIKRKESRIIICVDMLGEGFDLPELKIAALHDIHKSLGITLQFTGRFTRTKTSIGEATLIANIANQEVNDQLINLYSEDAEWNVLLKKASTEVINSQLENNDFLNGFAEGLIEEIPIQNIYPKMSTVVYKTKATRWYPERIKEIFPLDQELLYTVHSEKNILVAVIKSISPVSWGDIQEITNVSWDIYIAYWNQSSNLLFINSTMGGIHRELAESIIDSPLLISGEEVFRCFYGINRTILQNVGLNDAFQGPVRFTMYAGTDIEQGLTEAQKRNTFKSNIFGIGYENGEKTSMGCSYKGKIWSKKITTLSEWFKWCDEIGSKLLNNTINVDTLLEGVLKPKIIKDRPNFMPISIEWPMSFTIDLESNIFIVINEVEYPLYLVELQLETPSSEGNLRFKVCTESFESQFELVFHPDIEGKNYQYSHFGSLPIEIHKGSKKMPVTEWFLEDPPIFRFIDGSYMENNIYVSPHSTVSSPFHLEKIIPWSWDSVDITKESQKEEKRKNSIQYFLIQDLITKDYDVIFDDDSAGEAADVITIKVEDQRIKVEFYHCKYSSEERAGSRVSDLYAVCGQTQKSIRWKESIYALLRHMEKREAKRIKDDKPTRFEKGDLKKVSEIRKMAKFYPYDLEITIVQPGLSKSKMSVEQMELLSATENYLQETYKINMRVIASE